MGNALTDNLLFGKAKETDGSDLHLCIFRKKELSFGKIIKDGEVIVRGESPLSLPGAIADSLVYMKAFGLVEQQVTPTPTVPTGLVCNNGGLVLDGEGHIVAVGNVETIKDSKNNTATCEMLLGIASCRDEQDLLSGKIIRYIGKKVLDGTEDWTEKTQNTITWYEADILDNNMFKHLLCTHFVDVPVALNNNAVYKGAGESVLRVRYDDAGSLANFKQFLADQKTAGTPVILIYALETPIIESVQGQTLEVKSGDNTITITDASLSELLLEAKYRKNL